MRIKSNWVVAVASMMLLATSQTDHAFAALNSLTRNSAPQGISTATWAAVAGVDQNVTSADRAGSAYPMTLTSLCTPAAAITRTTTGSVTGSGRTITLTTAVTGLQVGYLVTGTGIANSYSLNTNPSSNSRRIGSFPDGPNGFRIQFTSGTSSSASGTTLTFTIAKQLNRVFDSVSGGSNDRRGIETIETTSDLEVGMTVRGSGINNSGSNTISAITTADRFITATGTNTDNNQILAFSNASVCTYFSFFTLKNTGDITINSMSITQSGTALSGGDTITWSTCAGTWNEAAGTCSGASNSILTTTSTSGAQQLTLTLAPGAWVRVQAESTPAGASATLNISVSVSTTDLRTATNTNA
jgi:hypothetical protein